MDGYAPAYVAHNVPYLVISGLGGALRDDAELEAEGVRIASDVPPIESEDAQTLLKHFRNADAEGLAWNDDEFGGKNKFKIKVVGRVLQQTQ